MNADSITFLNFDIDQFYLEIAENTLESIWSQTDCYSSISRRWQAYLNQVALDTFLPWLKDEQSINAKVWPNPSALPCFCEVVDGVAIQFEGIRLILFPTDTLDLNELRVPQEWVDIPSWTGDYYIAMQVNPDDAYLRVFGYTTHRQLKNKGSYDPSDRVYILEENDLTADLSILWIARQLCPEEIRQETVAPLPTLSLTQAENLLIRLGKDSILVPRLEIPFHLWGPLLEHNGWRRRLYERRMGFTEQWSVRQWLKTGISQAAQDLGWSITQWQPNLILSRGSQSVSPSIVFARQLVILDKLYELRVFPQGNQVDDIWRFELRSAVPGSRLPQGIKLRLLTEDLRSFDNNEDIAITSVDLLFIEVSLSPGEGLIWEIEPTPDNYEPEILRF